MPPDTLPHDDGEMAAESTTTSSPASDEPLRHDAANVLADSWLAEAEAGLGQLRSDPAIEWQTQWINGERAAKARRAQIDEQAAPSRSKKK